MNKDDYKDKIKELEDEINYKNGVLDGILYVLKQESDKVNKK